jgi:uncharacterized protein
LTPDRKYQFSWNLLGDIALGRPNLGNQTRLEMYRLMQFTFRDVLEKQLGSEKADALFYAAGELAGKHFFENVIGQGNTWEEFLKRLQESLQTFGAGILRIEETNLEHGRFVLTMSEDLDCSGLPELDYEVCTYDEGFLAGLLEAFTGSHFEVKEVDCWCTGDRTCRFVARRTGEIHG